MGDLQDNPGGTLLSTGADVGCFAGFNPKVLPGVIGGRTLGHAVLLFKGRGKVVCNHRAALVLPQDW